MTDVEEVDAAQVTIRWARYVVGVQLAPAGACWHAEQWLSDDLLGDSPLLVTGQDGVLRVLPPAGAEVTVRSRGSRFATAGPGTLSRRLAAGGHEPIVVSTQATIRVALGPLVFEVDGVQRCAVRWRDALSGALAGGSPFIAVSALAHLVLLMSVAYSAPALGAWGADDLSDEQRVWVQRHVSGLAHHELVAGPKAIDVAVGSGGTGQSAVAAAGAMGHPTATASDSRGANRWRRRASMPRLPRRATEDNEGGGAGFGMAGLLLGQDGVDDSEPSASWGLPDAQGNALDAGLGGLWGTTIGLSRGVGGLGLSGVGEGGGGRGFGIGLGTIGTIGRGAGTGRGAGLGRSHHARPPRVRCGGDLLDTASQREAMAAAARRSDSEVVCTSWNAEEPDQCTSWRVVSPCVTSVSGRLPPEIVQAVLQRNRGRFRLCYQLGLKTNPALQGRVVTRFIIRRDGSVSQPSASGTLPDR